MGFQLKDAKDLECLWKNNGKTPNGTMELSDALSVPDAPVFFPKVISNIVREAIEPLLVGTTLLQRINYHYGQQITFGAIGAMVAGDIAEGQEYPERSLGNGGGTVTASIGKSGVAVKITEEMIRYSQYDVIGMHLRAAGRALARHKEVKIFNFIKSLGVTVFDNINPTNSFKGVCTGRDLDGSGNGSVTMDDIFDTYAQILSQGFMPDTLLMHPLTWVMFVKDPVLRAFALTNGGGTMFANWTGNPGSRTPWDNQGGLGISQGTNIIPGGNAAGVEPTSALGYSQTLTSAPQIPSYFGMPFRIIVSPFVPYDARKRTTDIYMFDSNELGCLIVDEEVNTEEFNDPRVDMKKIKLRERYGIAILHEGQSIGIMKNVHVVPNQIVLPAQARIDVQNSALAAISPTASVL